MKTIHPGHLEHRFCIFGCQILCITDLAIMPLVCYRIFSVVGGVLSQHNTSICTCTAFFEYLAHEIGHGTKLLNTGQKGIIMNQQLIKIPSWHCQFSSPRAESARAVTGRWCPQSGRGEDFLSRQPDFFTETAVTPDRKVEKSFPRWEINRHVEG